MSAERETSIRRAIEVFLALTSEEAIAVGGLGVTRIAGMLGREKSQVSRTLQILSEYGLIDRGRDSLAYRLGWRLYAIAELAGERRLIDEARPLLAALVATFSERAHLSVLSGAEALTLLSQSPSHALQTVGWVGRTVPAYCTSAGRVQLLDLDRRELERLFQGVTFHRLGPNTVRSLDELATRIAEARAEGYAVVDEEFEPGLVGAAAPVRDAQGQIVAALNVSGPKFRLGDRLQECALGLREAAFELSTSLGAWGPASSPQPSSSDDAPRVRSDLR